MKKVFLSAGHTNIAGIDRGASGNGYIEGVLAAEFVNLLEKELKSLGVVIIKDNFSNALAQTMTAFKNLFNKKQISNKDIVIEIHWNAASPEATGTEVVIPGRTSAKEATSLEKKLALEISDCISSVLNIKNRGVKFEYQTARKKLGWMTLDAENILIEMCFISNKKDMESYQKNKELLAKTMAKIILDNAK